MGDQPVVEQVSAGPVVADTFGGRIHVEWDNSAPVTPLGQMPFFLYRVRQTRWAVRRSRGGLSGRYAHMTTVRCDPVIRRCWA
jgi:hypothetical protein